MDRLSPQHVPIYETEDKRKRLWERCVDENQPVVAVRAARRGYIVRYDLGHLGVELTPDALRSVRERTRAQREYPTASDHQFPARTDPISETAGVGGEAGSVSGDLHAGTERKARELASLLSGIVFDESGWQ